MRNKTLKDIAIVVADFFKAITFSFDDGVGRLFHRP